MSKSLVKYNYFGEFKGLQKKVLTLGKTARVISKHLEVKSTSGKTSKEIDNEVAPAASEIPLSELNGISISDPTNNLMLIRQNGEWRSVKTEPL